MKLRDRQLKKHELLRTWPFYNPNPVYRLYEEARTYLLSCKA